MTHDPLCPCESHKQPHIKYLGGHCHYCQCALIAKARNEALTQAIEAVRRVRTFDDWVYESQVVMHLDVLSALRALQEPS
jgi:hypothetical protein